MHCAAWRRRTLRFPRFLSQYDYECACKTGTGEWAGHDGYAWFAMYAPYDNPKYVVTCVITEGGAGASSAAPIAAKVMDGCVKLGAGALEKEITPTEEITQSVPNMRARAREGLTSMPGFNEIDRVRMPEGGTVNSGIARRRDRVANARFPTEYPSRFLLWRRCLSRTAFWSYGPPFKATRRIRSCARRSACSWAASSC